MTEHVVPETEPEEDDLDAIIARQKRKRLVLIGVSLAVVGIVAGAIGIYVATRPDPRCTDSEEVSAFLNEPRIPASIVYRVCTFPEPLAKALESSEKAPPSYRGSLVMAAVAESPSLITDVCPGGISALAEAPKVVPNKQVAIFLDGCDLSGTGIDVSAAQRASLSNVVLAVAVYGALKDSDSGHADALANRMLAGP